ncbi:MAG TPA: hypothetical protein VK968_13250, partial [Roseimicrobium sp.]|nr:hypothetical protein [Roseimicrobium sp.]
MNINLLILKDFYRRWWWAYLIGILAFAGVGFALGYASNYNVIPLAGGAFLGAVLIAADLNFRTNARTLLSLPVKAQELGRTLWLLSVPFSALILAVTLALGWWLANLCGAPKSFETAVVIRFFLLTMSVNALMTTIFTFMPHRMPDTTAEKVIGQIAGGAWGLVISFGFYTPVFWPKSGKVWDPVSLCILAGGIVAGIISWKRCSTMLRNRTRRTGVSSSSQTARAEARIRPERFNGIAWMFGRTFILSAGTSLLMMLMIQLMLSLMMQSTAQWSSPFMSLFPLLFVLLAQLQPPMSALRHWRSLPITTSNLSLIFIGLVLTTVCGAALTGGVATLFGMHLSLEWLTLPIFVLGLGLFTLSLAFLMYIGIKWTPVLLVIVMPVST